jgi:hypothetical protein
MNEEHIVAVICFWLFDLHKNLYLYTQDCVCFWRKNLFTQRQTKRKGTQPAHKLQKIFYEGLQKVFFRYFWDLTSNLAVQCTIQTEWSVLNGIKHVSRLANNDDKPYSVYFQCMDCQGK